MIMINWPVGWKEWSKTWGINRNRWWPMGVMSAGTILWRWSIEEWNSSDRYAMRPAREKAHTTNAVWAQNITRHNLSMMPLQTRFAARRAIHCAMWRSISAICV